MEWYCKVEEIKSCKCCIGECLVICLQEGLWKGKELQDVVWGIRTGMEDQKKEIRSLWRRKLEVSSRIETLYGI